MQAGRGPGRSKEEWGWEGGRKVRMGRERGIEGREEAMVLDRERASVEEGRFEGGWVDEGTERGMDSARERWEARGERRSD